MRIQSKWPESICRHISRCVFNHFGWDLAETAGRGLLILVNFSGLQELLETTSRNCGVDGLRRYAICDDLEPVGTRSDAEGNVEVRPN